MHRLSLGISTEAGGSICLREGNWAKRAKLGERLCLLESQQETEGALKVGILKRGKKKTIYKTAVTRADSSSKSLPPLLLKERGMGLVPETHGRRHCRESCLIGAMAQVTAGEDPTA